MEKQKRAYGRADRGINDTLGQIKHKESKDVLERFINEKIANGGELKPLAARLYTYKKIVNALDKPINKITKEDLVALLSKDGFNTIYYKKIVKQLFRWMDKPELIGWINTKKSIREKQNARPKIALKEEHVAAFLAACDNPQDRALFEVLADKAPKRPKDIENLRVKDVSVDDLGISLKFSSKTEAGNRTVYLQNSRAAFMKYWENHPFKKQYDKPVFYNMNKQHKGLPLMYCGIQGRFKEVLKRADIPADIKRDFTLYTFRRTVTTLMLQDTDYTPKEVQVMGGWSSIRMLDTYGKVTDVMVNLKKQVIEAKRDPDLLQKLHEKSKHNKALAKLMVKHGLIKESDSRDILGSIICPRCKEENLSNADACIKCWLPLNKKGFEDITEERSRNKNILQIVLMLLSKGPMQKQITKLSKEHPELKEELEKMTKDYL